MAARSNRPTLGRVLIVAVVVGVLSVGFLVALALSTPVGSQRDAEELGGDYCAYFPEDC